MILKLGSTQAELASSFQGFFDQRTKVVKPYESPLDQKDNILDVGVESAVDLAERQAVRIEDMDLYSAELTDWHLALVCVSGDWNETRNGNGLDHYAHVLRYLIDALLKLVLAQVIPNVVDVQRRSRTAEQTESAAAEEKQFRGL